MSYIDEQAREARAQERELRDPILGDCGLCGGKHPMDRRSRTFIGSCTAPIDVGPAYVAEMESDFEEARR